MIPTSRRLFSLSSRTNVGKKGAGQSSSSSDPFDIMNMAKEPFTFPLTRHTLLKVEFRRTVLRYLRLEEIQFKELVQLRQRFQKPGSNQVLQVRTQHYQGEPHPAARKASLIVPVSSLSLSTPAAVHKFKLLAGPRWNSDSDAIKISCELFPVSKMNEKWCSDTLDKLIIAAEDTTDLMADIPLDTRPTDSRNKKSGSKRIITLKDFPSEWLTIPAPTLPSLPPVVEAVSYNEAIESSSSSSPVSSPAVAAEVAEEPIEEKIPVVVEAAIPASSSPPLIESITSSPSSPLSTIEVASTVKPIPVAEEITAVTIDPLPVASLSATSDPISSSAVPIEKVEVKPTVVEEKVSVEEVRAPVVGEAEIPVAAAAAVGESESIPAVVEVASPIELETVIEAIVSEKQQEIEVKPEEATESDPIVIASTEGEVDKVEVVIAAKTEVSAKVAKKVEKKVVKKSVKTKIVKDGDVM